MSTEELGSKRYDLAEDQRLSRLERAPISIADSGSAPWQLQRLMDPDELHAVTALLNAQTRAGLRNRALEHTLISELKARGVLGEGV